MSTTRTSRRLYRWPEEGFTLIELLVVVSMILILVTIALAVFQNQQRDTIRRSIQYDVRNTATQVQLYLVNNRDATAAEIATEVEPVLSPDNVIVIDGDWETWIVYGYNEFSDPDGGWWFVYDSTTGTWTAVDERPSR